MRVLIKLGLVPVCEVEVVYLLRPRTALFISSLRLMCKCAKTDCIIMQMPQHNIRLMNYSDFQSHSPPEGQK